MKIIENAINITINGASKTLINTRNYLRNKGATPGVCPEHHKPCILSYTEDGIEIQDCIECGKDGALIPIKEAEDPEGKKSLRQIGIEKLSSIIASKSNKILSPGTILFCMNKDNQVIPIQLTGKSNKKTYECIKLDGDMLKRKVQAHLNSAAFSPSDIDNIIEYYLHNENTFVHVTPTYIAEPIDQFNLTYKLISHVVEMDTIDECPVWKSFLDRISDPIAFAAFIWSVFEIKHIGRQMLYLQGGDGEEGKSIMAKAIRSAIGEQYVASMRPNDFSTSSNFGLSKAEGRRLLIIPDVNNDKLLKYDGLKQVLGGDAVSIENKYEKAYTTVINCRVLAASNYALDLGGENFETSRLLWLEINEMKEFIDNLEDKLKDEFNKFLSYCKICYGKVCQNHYRIISEDSENRIKESLEVKHDDVASEYYDLFEYDPNYYITRKNFNTVIAIKKPNISSKEVNDIKAAMVHKGLSDFKLNNGFRITINKVRVPVYRGLRYANGANNE